MAARRSAQAGLDFSSPFDVVCGVDEAGRGPLAGPVVAAAVIFDPAKPRINGLDDSKALSAKRREELYEKIVDRDVTTGYLSQNVYDQIVGQLNSGPRPACAAGRDADAFNQLTSVKHSHGYR